MRASYRIMSYNPPLGNWCPEILRSVGRRPSGPRRWHRSDNAALPDVRRCGEGLVRAGNQFGRTSL